MKKEYYLYIYIILTIDHIYYYYANYLKIIKYHL